MDTLKAERQAFRTRGDRVRCCSKGDEASGQYFSILRLFMKGLAENTRTGQACSGHAELKPRAQAA